jgi:hypothetical protein
MDRKLRSIFTRTFLVAILSLSLLYFCDYLSVRYKIPKSRESFGSVQIQPYYAVPLKDGKTEFYFLDPHNETCVHSLFPHLGYRPCWYVNRNKQKRINV